MLVSRFVFDVWLDFFVIIYFSELFNCNSLDIMVWNFVIDMVFLKSRYGIKNGKDFGDGRIFIKDIIVGM